MPNDRRERLEAHYTAVRIAELELDPVRGTFDAAHLREINRRIFQDLPGLGFEDVTPGKYRPPVPAGNDWIKNRSLETVGASSCVAYSPMDRATRARLDTVLAGVDPAALARLQPAEFIAAIAKLYSELDYVHPFSDGNSRTLRAFTKQLATASGFDLDWNRFNRSPAGRDILYIARDITVNELALPHLRDPGTKRHIIRTLDQFGSNRALPDLLRDAISPQIAPPLAVPEPPGNRQPRPDAETGIEAGGHPPLWPSIIDGNS